MKKSKIKSLLKVKNEANSGKVKMYLYGDIGDGFFDGIKAKEVQMQLSSIQAEEIELHINSYGGDVFESIAIYNLLKDKEASITVVIDGIAASGGSIIAMAGDKIIMPKNCEMMIHNPITGIFGNAVELRKVADMLEGAQGLLETTYMDRFNGSLEELQAFLSEDTYFSAQEAVDHGLADEVLNFNATTEEDDAVLDEAAYDLIAEKVAAKITAKAPKEPKPESKKTNNSLLGMFKI